MKRAWLLFAGAAVAAIVTGWALRPNVAPDPADVSIMFDGSVQDGWYGLALRPCEDSP